MHMIIKSLLITFTGLAFLSCTVARVNSKNINAPTQSFVKIFNTLEIKSCAKEEINCPIGIYASAGSGMAINLGSKEMTILSAGHVCDMEPNEKVTNFTQTIKVMDHDGMIHPAWPIKITQYDQINPSASSGDLCLLWVPTLDVPKIQYSRLEPKVGDEVFYVGAPMGIFHPPTVPIFKGIFSGNINSAAAIATFPSIGGSSGSAVLDKHSKIIGVVFAANPKFHHVSLMTNYKSFMVFIKSVKKQINDIQ